MSRHREPARRQRAWAAALVLVFVAGAAAAATDTRELRAREEFAAGRYQQALDLFAKLYAETLHPVYLRNIGRCYQNLGDADRAIISFRDYLRKHEAITPKERKEVEGFIAEMEELKTQKGAAATPAGEGDVAATPPPPPPASSSITAAPEPAAKPDALVTAPAQPAAEPSPIYTRLWFWTIVGAAVVGVGLGIAAATGAFTTTKEGTCLSGYRCE